MQRPTAIIRNLLIMELLQDYISREIVNLKEQIRTEGLSIVDRKDNLHDIWVQYKDEHITDEAIYMRKMLDAEVKNRAKRTGLVP
ncbi:hypothetical protein [Alicyclobacillus fastidiosus]|uniref:Uncharacterized protein n=1 Tax=Alicyclobacillus fastidiosus TaxID=392011 RepID=A0ABV5AID0_9BACL|nr:hypothetical protein [Alicyclobacillus fastidiosus]WEH11130.1 hypothetical protein PYS47_07900 [Alicyclobacillus fastidiosus]